MQLGIHGQRYGGGDKMWGVRGWVERTDVPALGDEDAEGEGNEQSGCACPSVCLEGR